MNSPIRVPALYTAFNAGRYASFSSFYASRADILSTK